MRILLQWSQSSPQDWVEIDSSEWTSLPKKPLPMGGEVIDSLPGWLHYLNVQGVVFTCDHYAVEELNDGIRVYAWNDDPDDYSEGEKYARVCTFLSLAPDSKLGGAWNTRQRQTVYAQQAVRSRMVNQENTEYRPWEEFVSPPSPIIRHGVWVFDDLNRAHVGSLSRRGWREWVEGIPAEQIVMGRLKSQRSQGLYDKPLGTLTVFQRDTDLANGIHAAIDATTENALNATAGTGQTETSGTLAGGGSGYLFIFSSLAGFPNSAAWPTGNYRCQLDVSTAGADITYGLSNTLGIDGHFARVNSAVSSDLQSAFSSPDFSGTGLKLATTGTISWTAGSADDRFELLIGGTRAASHGTQSITLTFDSDAFADGPWQVETPTTTIFVTDDFQRTLPSGAGDVPLGANWVVTGTGFARSTGSQLELDIDNPVLARYVGASLGADQRASVRSVTSPTVYQGVGVRVSGTATSLSGYFATIAVFDLQLRKFVNQSADSGGTILLPKASTVTGGDRVDVEVVGTTVKVYKNSQLVGQVTDADVSSGDSGLISGGTAGGPGIARWDDFQSDNAPRVTDSLGGAQTFNETPSISLSLTPTDVDFEVTIDEPSVTTTIQTEESEGIVQTDLSDVAVLFSPQESDVVAFVETLSLNSVYTPTVTDDVAGQVFNETSSVSLTLVPTDADVSTATDQPSIVLMAQIEESEGIVRADFLSETIVSVPQDSDLAVLVETTSVDSVYTPTVTDEIVANVFTDDATVTTILAVNSTDVTSTTEAQNVLLALIPAATEALAGQVFAETPSITFALISEQTESLTLPESASITIQAQGTVADIQASQDIPSVTVVGVVTETEYKSSEETLTVSAPLVVASEDLQTAIDTPSITAVHVATPVDLLNGVDAMQISAILIPASTDNVTGFLAEFPETSMRLFTDRHKD